MDTSGTTSTSAGTSAGRHPSRRAVGLGAAAAGAAALTACGAGGSGGSSGPAELRFTWWGSDTRHRATQEVIDAFNAENPDIRVTGEYTEWSGYWDKLATTVAANDAPDVIQMDVIQLRSYADRGALLDLSQVEGIDTSLIDPQDLSTGQTDEGLFGLVNGIVPHAVIANPELFAAAGQELPDDLAWTWDDYERLGAAITQAGPSGTYGLSAGGLDEPGLALWGQQLGNDFYDRSGTVTLDPEVVASWWEYHLRTIESGAATPASLAVESQTLGLDQSGMATGTIGMQGIWATQVTAFTNAHGSPLALLRPPRQNAGGDSGLFYKAAMYWSISARTRYPEAAARFVDYLENSTTAGDIMLTERGIPANPEIRERIVPQLSETDALAVSYVDSLRDVVGPMPTSAPKGASAVQATVLRYGTDVLFGRQEPAGAAQGLVDELTASVESA
ncbi:ABC transporter substrate-binding protein [Kineococcus terrestris]|uniref:ABC transporter substrate-binding protein n=1 Tax=Kineococcus terrestris TaxID=2044856 RepID=UPI0034DB1027